MANRKPETLEAVQWCLDHPGVILAGVAQAYGIHVETLSRALISVKKGKPLGRPQSKKVDDALNYLLKNPNAVITTVAKRYGVHRVTLCVAFAKYRCICPTCGHPVRPH